MSVRVKGLNKVMKNLNKNIFKIRGNTKIGLEFAAAFVKGEAQELTSVDQGVLINSAFHKGSERGGEYSQTIGYTAKYAAAVHEMSDNTNWNKSGAENKFLEKAVTRNISKIINIIRRHASKTPR